MMEYYTGVQLSTRKEASLSSRSNTLRICVCVKRPFRETPDDDGLADDGTAAAAAAAEAKSIFFLPMAGLAPPLAVVAAAASAVAVPFCC